MEVRNILQKFILSPLFCSLSHAATVKCFYISFSQVNLNICEAVPQTYPMDEELLKLCMVNQLQRLGLAEHFGQEIEGLLGQVYRYDNRSK